MKRLLAIELQKIWKNKASRALTITYFVLLSTIALVSAMKFNIGFFALKPAEMGIFNFPFIWHFTTYIAVWYKMFLAIIIVSMMANEYTYGTLKQNLIDGLSKKEFLLSKFLTVILFALISTIFVFIMTLILGFCFSSYTELNIVFTDLEYLIAYFIDLVGFFSFCLFAGILVKRSAFALGFLLIWFFIEGALNGILRFFILKDAAMTDKVIAFFPLESISNLILEPWTRLSLVKTMGTQMGIENTKDYSVHCFGILIVLAWTIIFMLMSYKLLKKRDL
jgi:ABC-type transport system involved in multi-copper enzyme maturation permease subunit